MERVLFPVTSGAAAGGALFFITSRVTAVYQQVDL